MCGAGFENIALQPVFHRIVPECFANRIKLRKTFVGADPKMPTLIFQDCPDHVIRQTVFFAINFE